MADIRIVPAQGAINVTGSANFKGDGGSSVLFVTGSGQIGAGTTVPDSEFHIVGSGTRFLTLDRSGVRSYDLGVNSSGTFLVTDNSAAADRLAISVSGSVGIGTTNPGATLQVEGNTLTLNTEGSAQGKQLYFRYSDGANIQSDSYLYFSTGGSPTEKMRITSAGNVGIGVTAPSYKLEISGKAYASTELQANTAVMNTTTGYASFGSNSGTTPVRVGRDASLNDIIINADGNVGIGITNPSDKFYVAGNAIVGNSGNISPDSSGNGQLEILGNGYQGYVALNGTGLYFGHNSAIRTLVLQTNETDRLTIDGNTGAVKLNNYGAGSITGTAAYALAVDSSGNIIETTNSSLSGTGTANRVAYWTGTSTLAADADFSFDGTSVGIGTTSPTSKLSISDGVAMYAGKTGVMLDIKRNVTNGNDTTSRTGIRLGNNSNAFDIYYGGTSDRLRFLDGGDGEVMSLVNGGNVGIGLTNPNVRLHVLGPALTVNDENTYGLWVSETGDDTKAVILGYDQGIDAGIITAVDKATAWKDLILQPNGSRVGIGLTNPPQALSVYGNIYQRTGDVITWNNGDAQIGAVSGYALAFSTYDGSSSMVERMRITSAGNVGIGTTTPGYKLYVNGTSYFADTIYNGGGYISWTSGYGNGTTQTFNANSLAFLTNASSYAVAMFINSSGNVGVGTTSPVYRLHVSGGSEYIEGGFGTNTSTAYTSANRLIFNNDYSDSARGPNKITLYDASWLGGFGVHNDTLAYYTGGTHKWYQATNASNANHLMTLNSSGNLGLGTTSPSAKLQVAGDVLVDGKITAREFHTTFVSASIIYQSGSTQFGNSSDDTHVFTGNVGIGSASPAAKLDVVASNSTLAISYGNTVPNNPLHTNYYGGYTGIGMDSATAGVRIVGDTNTLVMDAGYYSSGTVQHANWNSLLRVLTNGNVGINTTSPATKLQVNGTFASNALWTDGSSIGYWGSYSTAYGGLTWDTGHATVFATSGNRLQFGSNGSSPDMTIGTGGNVGIGTTSPADLLHVYGGSADQFLKVQNTSTYTGLWLEDAGTNNGWLLLSGYTDGAAAGDFAIREYGVQTSLTIKQTSGNVGIGITNPSYKLHVNGGAASRADVQVTYNSLGTTNADGAQFGIQSAGAYIWNFENSPVYFGTNNTRRVDISSDGNVGIGSTSPTNKLEVVGGVTATSFTGSFKGNLDGNASTATTATNVAWTGVTAGERTNYTLGFEPADNTSSYAGFYFSAPGGSENGGYFLIRGGADNDVYTQNGITLVADAGWLTLAQRTQSDKGIRFMTGATSTTRMTIANGGNVGIGSTAPGFKLDVNGDIYANGDIRSQGIFRDYQGEALLQTNTSAITQLGSAAAGTSRQLAFLAGNAERMRINTSGDVGIGTTSPDGDLHVYGSATTGGIRVGGGNGTSNSRIFIEAAGNNSYIDSYGDSNYKPLAIEASVLRLNASSGGSVGIGTTSPSTKLHVYSSGGGLELNTGATTTLEFIDRADTAATVNTAFYTRYGYFSWNIGGYSEAMRITGAGNIGIGTTAPAYKFHLQGSNLMATFRNSSTSANQYTQLEFIAGSRSAYIWLGNQSTTSWAGDGGLNIYTTTGNMDLWTAGAQQMRIDSTGNVGIGTTGPSSKLHIKQTGIADNTATTLLLLDGQFNDSSIEEADMVSIGFRVENSSGGSQSSQAISFAYDNTLSLMKDGGKVGIGITTPSNRLTVYQGGGVRVTGITSGDWIEMSGNLPGYSDNQYPVIKSNGTIHFANNNKYSAFLEGANTYFGILDSSTVTRVFLTTSGNTYFTGGAVGIGTTNPASILNTSGAGNGITHDDSTAGKGYIRFRNSGTQLALFGIAGAWEGSSLQDTMVAAETGLNIRMYTNGSATPKMFISGSGNVGVGTTGPVGKLTVEGDGSANNTSGLIRIANTGGSTWGGIALVDGQTTVTNASNYYLIGRAGALTDRVMSFHIPTAGDYGSGSQPKIAFYSTGATVLYSVEASTGTAYHRGSVGIGTTSPLSELHVQGSSTEQILISLDSTKRMLMGRTSGYGWIAPYTDGVSYDNLVLARDGGNVGIGSTGPRAKLDVAGGITLRNSRVSTGEKYPVGHYSFGETVFEIDPTWTESQLQEFFNSSNVSWTADSTAPGGYAIQIDGGVNVGAGEYDSGFPYIPVDSSQDDWFYMECYIRNEAGSSIQHYMGGIDYDQSFSSLGGNPGSYTYNVMFNYNPGTSWTKVYGYWNGFGNSYGSSGTGNTNNWESGTKYFTPQALFNYNLNSGTRRCYISGWKCVRVRATGNRYYTDNVLVNGSVGIGTTSPAHKLSVVGQGTGVAHVGDAGFGSGNYTGISLNGTLNTSAYNFLSSPSDTHLYINRPSGKDIYFRMANSDQVAITSGGSVGIGTSAPDTLLHIRSSGNTFTRYTNTTSAGHYIDVGANSAGQSFVYGYGAYPLLFGTNGTERMRILSGGNIGIGNTGPNGALAFDDDVRTRKIVLWDGAANNDYQFYGLGIESSTFLHSIYDVADRYLWTAGVNSGARNEIMVLQGNGNLGIGTTSPTTKVNILIGAGGTNGTTGLKIGGTSNYDSLELGIEGDYNGQIRTYGNDLHIYAGHWRTVGSTATEDHAIRFFTSKTSSTNWSTPKMILTADGTVGIGSNSPSRTLDVNGNARIGNNTAQQSHAALQVSAGQGSATTYRDIDMCGSWAGGEGHAITANYGTSIDNIVGQIVFEHNGPGSRIKFGRLYDSGNQSTYPMHLVSNGSAGRLGIGTSVPTAPLDTLGVRVGRDFSIANRATVRLDSNTADYPADVLFGHTAAANESSWTGVYWSLSSRANDAGNKFYIYRGGGNPGGSGEAIIMALQPNGNIGIGSTAPAYLLDVAGTIRATGDVIAYSDARVKENIVTLENSLELVQKLRGVSYNKIGESEKKIGVVAQEVLEVLPEVVQQDSEGTYSVAYGNITAVLIEAIKQQQSQIDELKAEIKNLKSR